MGKRLEGGIASTELCGRNYTSPLGTNGQKWDGGRGHKK